MPKERQSQEFHVTPRGWVSGTCRENGELLGTLIDRPDDAIETWLEEMVIPYLHCADVYSWRLIWYDPLFTEEARRKLRKKFPSPSEDFPG